MNKKTSALSKWCGRPWLITIYAVGAAMLVPAAFLWSLWSPAERSIWLLTILLPLHVFEENTFPDGFHYMLNTVQKSARPNAGPMNRLTDMISNFGAELLFLLLFALGGNTATLVFAVFFGIGEAAAHTAFGIITRKRLRERGMRTIYGPGLATGIPHAPSPVGIFRIFSEQAGRKSCRRRRRNRPFGRRRRPVYQAPRS
jgi:hypothetical protein